MSTSSNPWHPLSQLQWEPSYCPWCDTFPYSLHLIHPQASQPDPKCLGSGWSAVIWWPLSRLSSSFSLTWMMTTVVSMIQTLPTSNLSSSHPSVLFSWKRSDQSIPKSTRLPSYLRVKKPAWSMALRPLPLPQFSPCFHPVLCHSGITAIPRMHCHPFESMLSLPFVIKSSKQLPFEIPLIFYANPINAISIFFLIYQK